jgi:pantothenate kinase type III
MDIGNTRIGAASVDGTVLVDRFEGNSAASGRDPESRAAEAFDWCLDQTAIRDSVEGLVISSVVPAQCDLVQALWAGHPRFAKLGLHVVTHRSPLPMDLAIAEPATVGADRFCNVAGAMALGHPDAIIADLGTANTFDVLVDGVFRGGLIGPGAVTSHRALIEAGAQLPELSFSWPVDLVGQNTADAMRSGSFHQAVGSVIHVIGRLQQRFPATSVLVTGGLAEMLGPEIGARALHIPGLTHVGAAAIGEAALN